MSLSLATYKSVLDFPLKTYLCAKSDRYIYRYSEILTIKMHSIFLPKCIIDHYYVVFSLDAWPSYIFFVIGFIQ